MLPKVLLREAHYYTEKTTEKEKVRLPPTPRTTQQPESKQLHKGRGRYAGLGQEHSQRGLAQSGAQHVEEFS